MFCLTQHFLKICFAPFMYDFPKDHTSHVKKQYISKRNVIAMFIALCNACYLLIDISYGLRYSLDNPIELKNKIFHLLANFLIIFGILVLVPTSQQIIFHLKATTEVLVISNLFGKPLLKAKDCKHIVNLSKAYRVIIIFVFICSLIVSLLSANSAMFHYNITSAALGSYGFTALFFNMLLNYKTAVTIIENLQFHLQSTREENDFKLLIKLYIASYQNVINVYHRYFLNYLTVVVVVLIVILIVFTGLVVDVFILINERNRYMLDLLIIFSSAITCFIIGMVVLVYSRVLLVKVSLRYVL